MPCALRREHHRPQAVAPDGAREARAPSGPVLGEADADAPEPAPARVAQDEVGDDRAARERPPCGAAHGEVAREPRAFARERLDVVTLVAPRAAAQALVDAE